METRSRWRHALAFHWSLARGIPSHFLSATNLLINGVGVVVFLLGIGAPDLLKKLQDPQTAIRVTAWWWIPVVALILWNIARPNYWRVVSLEEDRDRLAAELAPRFRVEFKAVNCCYFPIEDDEHPGAYFCTVGIYNEGLRSVDDCGVYLNGPKGSEIGERGLRLQWAGYAGLETITAHPRIHHHVRIGGVVDGLHFVHFASGLDKILSNGEHEATLTVSGRDVSGSARIVITVPGFGIRLLDGGTVRPQKRAA